jgi:GT2 family glycosyltransferase/glycosyltransferase involved in cell wall biosynthesis
MTDARSDDRGPNELQAELDTLRRDLARAQAEIALLKSAPRLEISLLWQWRMRLFPTGTRRERLARTALRAFSTRGLRVLPLPLARAAADPPVTYDQWIRRREPDTSQLRLQRTLAKGLSYRPLISLVCPVFNPPASVLADTLASVQAQTYDHWEFILVACGPQPAEVDAVLGSCADDPRVIVVPLEQNLGIAGNTNAGIAAAHGDYVAFVDHDDLIAPDAFYEVARLLNHDPDADVVYFDEDKISADGQVRGEPYFKPDWSPEHLLSINFLMHSVVRRRTLAAVGPLDSRFDGAQDWDLAFRLLEHGVKARHLHRVLYHWRKVPGSSATVADAKPWAIERQAPCLAAHLERRGFTGVSVESPALGVLRPRWQGRGTRVSIVIPTRDRADLVRKCLSSIFELTRYDDYEVLLVDTGSSEPATARLYEELAANPRLRLLHLGGEFNYSGVNNWAASQATGDILVFLNNDIEVLDHEWLAELARWAELEEIGCVGTKLLYPDGRIQHAGLVVGMEGHASQIYRFQQGDHHWGPFGSPESYRNPLAVTGACLAIKRRAFDAVGGFDESYRLCYNDIDLCLRVAGAGFRNMFTPFAALIHHEGASRGFHVPSDEVLRASVEMLPLVMHGDPSFNPALTYASTSPTLAGENEPEERANRIALIARQAGVFDLWSRAWDDELAAVTAKWSRYRSLFPATPRLTPEVAAPDGALRTLIVTHDLTRSGAPTLAAHLTEYLCAQGHRVTVLSPKPGPMREEFEARGAQVVVSPAALTAAYAMPDLFARHDVVLANTVLAWRTVISARAAGLPCVWMIHESNFGQHYARSHPSIVQAFAAATCVAFPSLETEGRYRDFHIPRSKIIHYGINPLTARTQVFEKDPAKLYAICAGNFEERKGQDVLVAALAHVPERVRQNLHVVLMGAPLEAEFHARLCESAAQMPCVHFRRQAPAAEMLDLMATSDVLICPSRDDPSPLVVIDAMALGRTVLSTRVGAVPELISDGEHGLLVDKDDARGMAAALVRLHDDRALAARLGAAARRRFEDHLTLDRFGAEVLSELRRTLGTAPSRSPII